MEDTVRAITLEQATSTDFLRSQAFAARRPTSLLAMQSATHELPVQNNDPFSLGNSYNKLRSVITGLQVRANGTSGILVGPGSLTQPNVSWTTTPPVTVVAQTGINHAEVSVPFVSTAGLGLAVNAEAAYHLLCARVAEVSTTSVVNVYSEAAQDFVPQSVNKITQLCIEFKWVLGESNSAATTKLPALDSGGAGWEPLAYVSFVYPDGTGTERRVIDVARRTEGLTGEWTSPLEASSALGLGAHCVAAVSGAYSPHYGTNVYGLVGSVTGSHDGERVMIRSTGDSSVYLPVDSLTTETSPAEWTPIHYYLCPLRSSSGKRWPLKTLSSTTHLSDALCGVQRGLLVASRVAPNRQRVNSSSITLADSTLSLQQTIQPGEAVYVATGFSRGGWGTHPFVQSSGGDVSLEVGEIYHNGSAYVPDWRCPPLFEAAAMVEVVSDVNRAFVIDLTDIVPRFATSVRIAIFQPRTINQSVESFFEARARVLTEANRTPNALAAAATISASPTVYCGDLLAPPVSIGDAATRTGTPTWLGNLCATMDVPIGWCTTYLHADSDGTDPNYHMKFLLRQYIHQPYTVVPPLYVRLVGWKM